MATYNTYLKNSAPQALGKQFQFADYAIWEKLWLQTVSAKKQGEYWKGKLFRVLHKNLENHAIYEGLAVCSI